MDSNHKKDVCVGVIQGVLHFSTGGYPVFVHLDVDSMPNPLVKISWCG